MLLQLRRLQPTTQRMHHRGAHTRIRVLKLGENGGCVLRKCQCLYLTQDLHRRLARTCIGVLEHGNDGWQVAR
jgi:hypothetical protein